MATLSIKGLNKGAVLAALFNASKPQGMGFMHYNSKPMTSQQGQVVFDQNHGRFDYLEGRVMKINLTGDEVDTWGYDRDNGQEAAEKALTALRASGNVNDATIDKTHQANTLTSALATSELLDSKSVITGNQMRMGLSDVKQYLEPKVRAIVGSRNG